MSNAIYFKAPWTDGFRKEKTAPATFNNEDGTKSEVQMMKKTDPMQIRYATAKEFDLASLSFGEDLKKDAPSSSPTRRICRATSCSWELSESYRQEG